MMIEVPPGSFGMPEDWKYFDLPNMLPIYMDELKGAMGKENYKFITFAERTWPDGETTVRGQIFISPEGLDNIKKLSEKNAR